MSAIEKALQFGAIAVILVFALPILGITLLWGAIPTFGLTPNEAQVIMLNIIATGLTSFSIWYLLFNDRSDRKSIFADIFGNVRPKTSRWVWGTVLIMLIFGVFIHLNW